MLAIHPGDLLMLLDPQTFAYETGITLRGFSVNEQGGEWRVIFRGTDRKKGKVYCLYVAVELSDAIRGLVRTVTGRNGSQYWYKDKYAK